MVSPLARRARGLTLIEMAVAIALTVTLTTLALPYFGDLIARHRLKAAAEGLLADISEARFEAARRGQTLHIAFAAGNPWCYTVATAPGCHCASGNTCRVKAVIGSEFGGIEMPAAEDLVLTPEATGAAVPRTTRLQTAKGAALEVRTSPLGRPGICVAGGTVAGYPRCP
jgi:type IV fimbrial biogenesis protein FimT